jgi:hypothetical protein
MLRRLMLLGQVTLEMYVPGAPLDSTDSRIGKGTVCVCVRALCAPHASATLTTGHSHLLPVVPCLPWCFSGV